MIDWHYPWIWQVDFVGPWCSLWLGWWLVIWDKDDARRTLHVVFQPGL